MWNNQERHAVCSRNKIVEQPKKISSLFHEQKCGTGTNSQERHLVCSRNRNVEQSRKTSSLFQEQKCGTIKKDI
jgi:hypothetical protein